MFLFIWESAKHAQLMIISTATNTYLHHNTYWKINQVYKYDSYKIDKLETEHEKCDKPSFERSRLIRQILAQVLLASVLRHCFQLHFII